MKILTLKDFKTTILVVSFILFFSSCHSRLDYQQVQLTSKPVFITGKIINHKPENNTITAYVNDLLSGDQITFVSLIDSLGNFQIKFDQYYPQDLWLRYGNGALTIIAHPEDSINIKFDANYFLDSDKLSKTIEFSGDGAETNYKLIIFKTLLFKTYIPWEKYCLFEKDFSPAQFVKCLDSLKSVQETVINNFIKDQNPPSELKTWMNYEINMDYNYKLAMYPYDHAKFNKLDYNDIVPLSFYDFMNISLPNEALINSKSVDFISRYRFSRVNALMISNGDLYKNNNHWIFKGETSPAIFKAIQKNIQNSTLQELLIARELYGMLDKKELRSFEEKHSIFEKTINKSYLREPLINKYIATIRNFENPAIGTKVAFENIKNTPAQEFIGKIMEEHKGKIIYLDIWATWCSPCRKEMPNSKILEKKINNDKVAFVYICIDSKEDIWKTFINEMGKGGNHYFASPDQSRFITKLFEMNGVPQYVLIDQKGNLIKKGFDLRPSNNFIEYEILKLLKE